MLEVLKLGNGPECPLADHWPPDRVGHRQNMMLDVRREGEQAHDLSHPGAGDSLATGDGRLVSSLARLQQRLPLERFAKEFDHPGRLGLAWWLGPASAGRGRAHDTLSGYAPRHGTDVAVPERAPRPKRDLDRLFAVGGAGRAVAAVRGDV